MSAAPSIRKTSSSGAKKTPVSFDTVHLYTLVPNDDLSQENLTDTISLPHGDSLWPHHEGQWESKVLETDNNQSNKSEADPWEGPHSGV